MCLPMYGVWGFTVYSLAADKRQALRPQTLCLRALKLTVEKAIEIIAKHTVNDPYSLFPGFGPIKNVNGL